MNMNVCDDRGLTKHRDQIQFFNDLVIDLKLQLLAKPSREPIDMPRLELATAHLVKLEQCREKVNWK